MADAARARSNVYPSIAQIAPRADSIFLDSLMVDIERLERITAREPDPAHRMSDSTVQLRPVKVLFITPSQPLERMRRASATSCRARCAYPGPTGGSTARARTSRATCCSRSRSAAR